MALQHRHGGGSGHSAEHPSHRGVPQRAEGLRQLSPVESPGCWHRVGCAVSGWAAMALGALSLLL